MTRRMESQATIDGRLGNSYMVDPLHATILYDTSNQITSKCMWETRQDKQKIHMGRFRGNKTNPSSQMGASLQTKSVGRFGNPESKAS